MFVHLNASVLILFVFLSKHLHCKCLLNQCTLNEKNNVMFIVFSHKIFTDRS